MIGTPNILRSIRGKLLFSFTLLVTSLAVFVFLFFPARLERQAMEAVAAKAHAISDVTAYSLGAGVYFGDSTAVHDVLKGAARAPDIEVLIVRDTAKKIIGMWRSGTFNPSHKNYRLGVVTVEDSLKVVTSPIMHADQRIGNLTVAISLRGVRRDVQMARRLGSLVGLLILVIGFAVVYAISTLVTRPLRAVVDTVERIAAGDLTIRAEETSTAEVALLVRSFNLMVDTLATAQSELSANNAQLEARVDIRTAELREAVKDQQRARMALVASETEARATSETLQSVIDVAPQAIVSIDLDWNVTRWNNAAEVLFGWSAQEVLGKRVPLVPDSFRAEFRTLLRIAARSERGHAKESVRHRKDGSPVTVLVAVSVLRDSSAQLNGYIAVITDLTERKSLEDQLRQSQKMEAIGRLAGGVAHDFNNMLTVITASAAMLRSNVTGEEREDVEAIATAAIRASALTRQLLLFSRKQVVNLISVNLNDVVAEMSPMLRRLVREDIQFKAVLRDELHSVKADPTQLQQAVMNLVVNASDAMPDGGVLTIETCNVVLDAEYAKQHSAIVPGSYVQLTISDTGIGMDASTQAKIFEPFFTTKVAGVGTGLGLATTYAVVSGLNGHIGVYSEVGLGTAIKIYLPRTVLPAAPPTTPLSLPALPMDNSDVTVLLVEDEPSVRQTIRRMLERFGYSIIEAADGESGLALATMHGELIDIVLTDLMMPGMNGRTFADRLAQEQEGLPVIFMSGYTDETVNHRGLVDQNRAFLQKPFNSQQLVRTIHDLLGGDAAGGAGGASGRAVGSGTANASVGGVP